MPDRLRAAFSPALLGGYLASDPANSTKKAALQSHLIYTGKRSIFKKTFKNIT